MLVTRHGPLGTGLLGGLAARQRLEIGDVGVMADGRFTATGPLDRSIERGLLDAGGRDELTYDGEGAVSVTFKAAGESPEGLSALAAAEAGARARFGREHAAPLASLGGLAANGGLAHRHRLGYTFTGRSVTPFFRLIRLRRTFTGRMAVCGGLVDDGLLGREGGDQGLVGLLLAAGAAFVP